LGTFEKWRRDLGLEKEEGMARFELEKWPSWQKERNKEELRRIVFGGPQVRAVVPCWMKRTITVG
jgi:hypothetical protein